MARKTTLILLSVLLLYASVFAAGAFAVPGGQLLAVGDRVEVALTGGQARFSFTPGANSAYAVYLFPDGEAPAAEARLYRGNELIATGGGTMPLLEARLSAGEEYSLALTGRGSGILEIMRETLGRSFDRPIALNPEDGGYEKLLVRPGDAHWYAFAAEYDGPATIHAGPTDAGSGGALLLEGAVLDANGRELFAASGFAIDCELEKGAVYYVRVSADEDTTGAYALFVEQDGARQARPEAISLSADALSLEVGESQLLGAMLLPADAHPSVVFTSSDSTVATVSAEGEVFARSAGQAVVTARGWGGASASCAVTVARVPLSGIGFSQSELTLRVGERVSAQIEFFPADASDRRIRYFVEGAGVASVAPDGVVTGLREGTARVTAVAEDGGYSDILEVTVEPPAPKRRALLVGQQMYDPSVNSVRVGSINTAQSMASMLGSQSVDGESYQTTVLLDASRDEVFAAVRGAFRDATDADVSLFYITCHGYYRDGMSFLQMYDGSLIAAIDLERELRKIPGTVAVVVDSCGSGGLIGRASNLGDFNLGIVRVFSGRVGGAPFASGKYKVIASASLDQDSYRLSFDENATESDMATVLARALCDGAGWSLNRSRRGALRADLDYDRLITLNEIQLYATRRVPWYLNVAGRLAKAKNPYVQNVQVYPEGDPFVLFGR